MAFQFITPYSVQLGIVGAGTMGSGIALAALYSGLPVILYDVSPAILDKAREYITKHLERKNLQSNLRNLRLTGELSELHSADIVIEAIPEDLEMKQDLFARLEDLCPPPAILATNTSTLPVTAIAAATSTPERVAGLHFFNPAPVLPLVEVVRGPQTSGDTVRSLVALAEKMGKTPVVTRDTPGFIVNRVARPFYGESLRLLGEGVATHQQIDQVIRLGGGFRMGPFQLMDLIGIDINLAAMQSMYEQTFGEPRYRPHPIQVQMVQQKALGRKTGRGFYRYDEPGQAEDPAIPRPGKAAGQVLVLSGSWAPGLSGLLKGAGYTQIRFLSPESSRPVAVFISLGKSESVRKSLLQLEREIPADVPLLCQCADTTLTEIATWMEHPERLAGFDGLFLSKGPLATLVASPTLTPLARASIERLFATIGCLTDWIQDSPALILPRIVAMLANEAAFAVMEGVAESEKIDLAMRLGVNYPKGPLAWAKEVGYAKIVAVLDHLHNEFGEDRYRVAPLLRRWARLEQIKA